MSMRHDMSRIRGKEGMVNIQSIELARPYFTAAIMLSQHTLGEEVLDLVNFNWIQSDTTTQICLIQHYTFAVLIHVHVAQRVMVLWKLWESVTTGEADSTIKSVFQTPQMVTWLLERPGTPCGCGLLQ